MKHPLTSFSQHYKTALCSHLDQKSRPDPQVIARIGSEVRAARVSMLDWAKLHEQVLIAEILPGCPPRNRAALIRHAGNFFAATIAAAGSDKEGARDSARLRKSIESLSGRTVELAAANRRLGLEIIQRKKVETALRKSERDLLKSLEQSEALKEQLRGLSRQILSAQEEERKKISRELHDVIAQALLGINVRLATLKTKAGINTEGLARNIARTQKMVTKSADIVHQFARKLRPAVLDDLGLIPALHSFMKSFTARTGVRTHLTVFAGVESLSAVKRTVLYRVAQEALNNVDRHAHASHVEITIRKEAKSVFMEVSDNGCSFQVEQVLRARGSKRLGLLGMRERVEMVGGRFMIESEPGMGTKIIARIPVSKATEKKWRAGAVESQPHKS
jgi:signal transduction histidine kinase